MSRHQLFGLGATLAVVLGVVLGFWNLGGPGRQRDIAADQRRSADLTHLSTVISQWYAREKQLPADVRTLRSNEPDIHLLDPLTGAAYEYQPAGETRYQLCATFAFPGSTEAGNRFRSVRFDSHSAGRQCFTLDAVRAEFYQ